MIQKVWLSTLAATFLMVPPGAPQTTILNFSTYLGGSGQDSVRDVATDSAGNVYAVGGTASATFPVTLGPGFNSGSCSSLGSGGPMDVFITKFSPSGQIVWSRLLGGPCYDRAYAVELDPSGNIYVAGRAGAGFPTTANARQATFGGDTVPNNIYGAQDGFIAKLSPSGAVLWATYFGGNDAAIIRDIAVDASGNVYPVMQHVTANQPHVTPGSFDASRPGGEDMLAAKLTAAGQLVWGTYYGGTGYDGRGASIRVDSANQPVVLGITASTNLPTKNAYQATNAGGQDFAIAKFTADGSALVFSSYLGGSQDEGVETHHLEIGQQDTIYMAALVRSADFPTTPGAYQRVAGGGIDIGVAKFSPTGQLLASSYYGGAGTDGVQGVDIDAAGNVVFFGGTTTATFDAQGGYQTDLNGPGDAYVVKMSPDLSQNLYVTYFGGGADDTGRAGVIAPSGAVIFGGETTSSDYPVKNPHDSTFGAGGSDAVVTSLMLPNAAVQTPAAPLNLRVIIR